MTSGKVDDDWGASRGVSTGRPSSRGCAIGTWRENAIAGSLTRNNNVRSRGPAKLPVAMTDRPRSPDRPEPLELVNRYLLSASFNHQDAFRVHRQLVELDAAGEHARTLLAESASIALAEIPVLVRDLRALGRRWSEQDLLDPPMAEATARQLQLRFAELRPALDALFVRQDGITAGLVGLLKTARRG